MGGFSLVSIIKFNTLTCGLVLIYHIFPGTTDLIGLGVWEFQFRAPGFGFKF